MARATWRQRSSAVKRAVSRANVAVARARVRLRWPIPCGVPRPTLRRCVRRVTKSRGHSPWRGAQRREHTILSQPFRDKALRAVCFVRLLAKGMARATWRQRSSAVKRAVGSANVAVARARVRLRWPIPCGIPRPTLRRCIRFVVFLASHPAKPSSRSCGTYSVLPCPVAAQDFPRQPPHHFHSVQKT